MSSPSIADLKEMIRKFADEIGISEAALKIYLARAHNESLNKVSLAPQDEANLKAELAKRAAAMKLDDVAKVSLEIDWVASYSAQLSAQLDEIESAAKAIAGSAVEEQNQRISALENAVKELSSKDGSSTVMPLIASLQGMIESQGRELDQLRNAVQSNAGTKDIEARVNQLEEFNAALRAAVQGASDPKVLANAAPEPVNEILEKARKRSQVAPPEAPPTPAKIGVKREIEYNYLLERMGFRRLDSYTENELSSSEILVPTDSEIKLFLAEHEMGCSVDEVEIVNVHRGEYQMVQYQRVEKPSAGLKGWIPSKRK